MFLTLALLGGLALGAHNPKPILKAEHTVGHAMKTAAVKTAHVTKTVVSKF